jgi:hypothetical protein
VKFVEKNYTLSYVLEMTIAERLQLIALLRTVPCHGPSRVDRDLMELRDVLLVGLGVLP